MHSPTSQFEQITVTAGTTSAPYWFRSGIQCSVTALPGSGGTMLVQYTTSKSDATTINWINWPSGTVSANTSDSLLGRVSGIRATATTANGTLEILE